MSKPRRFLVDSNILIEAHKAHYAWDFCPGFWDALVAGHAAGRVLTIDRVKEEIEKGKDWISTWAVNDVPTTCFAATKTDAAVIGVWTQCQTWASGRTSPSFTPEALLDFARVETADAWLVAYAAIHKYVVITHEISEPQRRNKVKIPDACKVFGVAYDTPFQMLRELGTVLIERPLPIAWAARSLRVGRSHRLPRGNRPRQPPSVRHSWEPVEDLL